MIKRHWSYLKYIIRHKWFVWKASRFYCPHLRWQILVHDLSKFRPQEWIPYARTFYKSDGSGQYVPDEKFNQAWLKHIHRNPHHWQYWVLREDSGDVIALDMPKKYIEEMVADWAGAGRAITGRWEIKEWYEKNRRKMSLSENTEAEVQYMIIEMNKFKG